MQPKFDLPPAVAARLQFRALPAPAVGLDLMIGIELERWWAEVWRGRGLPDAGRVTWPNRCRAAAKRTGR